MVACGREYLYSAPAVDAPEVAQAAACFELLPDGCAEAAAELAVIELLRELPGLGVTTRFYSPIIVSAT